MAPTPLTGTADLKSDYNMAPGQVLVGEWTQLGQQGTPGAGTEGAVSPATIGTYPANYRIWNDPTHKTFIGQKEETLGAFLALAPIAAPGGDVNYVAGRRYGTSDNSVALINVKAGATAGTAMSQPKGFARTAGGVVCVLDRQ
ncbi:Uncharacterised protein [Salmonella enterica subsp. salamae]|nr:Uncharacterised protein [Salmonella enterica subsp. salamae]